MPWHPEAYARQVKTDIQIEKDEFGFLWQYKPDTGHYIKADTDAAVRRQVSLLVADNHNNGLPKPGKDNIYRQTHGEEVVRMLKDLKPNIWLNPPPPIITTLNKNTQIPNRRVGHIRTAQPRQLHNHLPTLALRPPSHRQTHHLETLPRRHTPRPRRPTPTPTMGRRHPQPRPPKPQRRPIHLRPRRRRQIRAIRHAHPPLRAPQCRRGNPPRPRPRPVPGVQPRRSTRQHRPRPTNHTNGRPKPIQNDDRRLRQIIATHNV